MQGWVHKFFSAREHIFLLILFTWSAAVCIGIITDTWWMLFVPLLFPLIIYLWNDFRPFYFLLLAALPFSIEFLFNESIGTDLPDEPMMLVMSGFVLMLLVYRPALLKRKMFFHPLMFILYAQLAWMLVTVIASTDAIVSAKYFLAKWWYVLPFVFASFLFLQTKKDFKNAGLALSIPVVILVLISLLRFIRYDFAFASVNDTVTPFFRNHVNYGAMLVCVIPVIVAFYFLFQKKGIKKITIGLLIIALTGLIFSYSRGAWLALVVGIITWWCIRKKIIHILYVSILIGVTGIFIWFGINNRYLKYAPDYSTTVFHADFREHMEATYELKDVSTIERFYRWIAGIRMSSQNLVTGYGPNTFSNNYKPYAVKYFRTWVSNNEDKSTVHNYFLLLLTEQGIPGLLFFIVLTGYMFYYAQQLYHKMKDQFYRTISLITGIMLSMILTLNFLSDLIETDKIGSLFFLCLAALVIIDLKKEEQPAA